LKIVWQRDRFEFEGKDTYDHREELKAVGSSWDKDNKVWWAPLSSNIGRLRPLHPMISPEAMAKYSEQESVRRENIEASRATDAEVDIPSPPGLQYLGYQKAGIQFALRVFGDL
jgi:hypothetical protein